MTNSVRRVSSGLRKRSIEEKQPLRAVPEFDVFKLLRLAMSEKQIPQVAKNIEK